MRLKDKKIGTAPLLRYVIFLGGISATDAIELLNQNLIFRGRGSTYFAEETGSYFYWLGEGHMMWFDELNEKITTLSGGAASPEFHYFLDVAFWHICIFVVVWFLCLFLKNHIRRAKPFASFLKSILYWLVFAWLSFFTYWIAYFGNQHKGFEELERNGIEINFENDVVYTISAFSAIFISLNIIFYIFKIFQISTKTRNHRLGGAINEAAHVKRARAYQVGDVKVREIDSEDSSDGENSSINSEDFKFKKSRHLFSANYFLKEIAFMFQNVEGALKSEYSTHYNSYWVIRWVAAIISIFIFKDAQIFVFYIWLIFDVLFILLTLSSMASFKKGFIGVLILM